VSMPSRPIILPIFAVVVRSNLLEEHIMSSFRPGLMQISWPYCRVLDLRQINPRPVVLNARVE
jgi:hypothetical protein